MKDLIYSPKGKIPLFKLNCDPSGIKYVEYRNSRTGCTERIKVSRLIVYLLEEEMMNNDQECMLYSPERKIPLGMMVRDQHDGTYYIEIKCKKNKERIRFSTYVSLLLESELKAS